MRQSTTKSAILVILAAVMIIMFFYTIEAEIISVSLGALCITLFSCIFLFFLEELTSIYKENISKSKKQ